MLAEVCKDHRMNENEVPQLTSESPQSKGGIARADSLTKEQRSEIARSGALAKWEAARQLNDPSRMPVALREGQWKLGAVDIDCYVLDNFKRVIHKRGMARALNIRSGGGNVFLRTMQRKGLGSVIPEELRQKIDNPLIFKTLNSDPGPRL